MDFKKQKSKNGKSSSKINYSIQVVVIVAIFSFVLFNLVFKLIIDFRSEAVKKKAEQMEVQRIEHEFIVNIDKEYDKLMKLYAEKKYDKAIEIVKVFNQYGKSNYKDLKEIEKKIKLYRLKKKLEFIPKIQLNEDRKLSKDVETGDVDTEEDDAEEEDTIEVFIRTPRYGQFFYTSDFPIICEGIALTIKGDFSEDIKWSSSLDGALGKGKQIEIRPSIGEHEITATGTDGITTGSMAIQIIIEKDPAFLKEYKKQ